MAYVTRPALLPADFGLSTSEQQPPVEKKLPEKKVPKKKLPKKKKEIKKKKPITPKKTKAKKPAKGRTLPWKV